MFIVDYVTIIAYKDMISILNSFLTHCYKTTIVILLNARTCTWLTVDYTTFCDHVISSRYVLVNEYTQLCGRGLLHSKIGGIYWCVYSTYNKGHSASFIPTPAIVKPYTVSLHSRMDRLCRLFFSELHSQQSRLHHTICCQICAITVTVCATPIHTHSLE